MSIAREKLDVSISVRVFAAILETVASPMLQT
jgi:hypothetical protein